MGSDLTLSLLKTTVSTPQLTISIPSPPPGPLAINITSSSSSLIAPKTPTDNGVVHLQGPTAAAEAIVPKKHAKQQGDDDDDLVSSIHTKEAAVKAVRKLMSVLQKDKVDKEAFSKKNATTLQQTIDQVTAVDYKISLLEVEKKNLLQTKQALDLVAATTEKELEVIELKLAPLKVDLKLEEQQYVDLIQKLRNKDPAKGTKLAQNLLLSPNAQGDNESTTVKVPVWQYMDDVGGWQLHQQKYQDIMEDFYQTWLGNERGMKKRATGQPPVSTDIVQFVRRVKNVDYSYAVDVLNMKQYNLTLNQWARSRDIRRTEKTMKKQTPNSFWTCHGRKNG
jgi:hypothetical protein